MTQVDDYCTELLKKGRKKSTLDTYRSSLNHVVRILEENGKHTRAEEITEEDIYFLQRNLKMKEPTVRANLMLLNGMIEYYTGKNLVKKMSLLWNPAERDRVFITKEDFRKMYLSARPMERVILVLGGLMGLRRDEMQHITLQDIGVDYIRIHGKGHGEEGHVKNQYMPKEVKIEIEHYLKQRAMRGVIDKSGGRLITHETDNGILLAYADRCGALSDIVRELGEKVGVRATCHSLRRFYCTELAANGCPLEILKDLMRHANINTTINCYLKADDRKKKEIAASFAANITEVLYTPQSI